MNFDEFLPNREISTPERKKRDYNRSQEQQKNQLAEIDEKQQAINRARDAEAKEALKHRKEVTFQQKV